MASYTRSERRHERNRMIAKRYRQDALSGKGAVNEVEWRFKSARVRATTGTVCSCLLCCNVRRKYGNSASALTRQELVAKLAFQERD